MNAVDKVRNAAERSLRNAAATPTRPNLRAAALARLVLALVPPGACSAGPCPICTAVAKCAEELDA